MTRSLSKAGRLMNIEMLDHIIIGSKEGDPQGQGYYSFNEAGLLDSTIDFTSGRTSAIADFKARNDLI